MKKLGFAMLCLAIGFAQTACKKDDNQHTHYLRFTIKTDSTQQRLNNLGQPATVPAGNAAQSPRFHKIGAHYIELTPTATTALGAGAVLYHATETTQGGSTAILFDSSKVVAPGEEFLSLSLKDVPPGTYNYIRVSLSYQNYDIDFNYNGISGTGRLASFVGYNSYIKNLTINTQSIAVNANKLQGFWAFETFGTVSQGQAPAGATTVPNPLFATSPIPQGSCVVTGQFAQPLVITGDETADKNVIISLSTNNSFEWRDNGDGIFNPGTDTVVDMGLRGMIPTVQ